MSFMAAYDVGYSSNICQALALGESAYVGLLHLHGALAAAAADERRPMKESALRTFCQKHPFPAAAAASPHVAAAAAAHCAAVAPQMDAKLAREALAALIATLERKPPSSDNAMDKVARCRLNR